MAIPINMTGPDWLIGVCDVTRPCDVLYVLMIKAAEKTPYCTGAAGTKNVILFDRLKPKRNNFSHRNC